MFAFRELSSLLENRLEPSRSAELTDWLKNDAIAKASVALSLSNEDLKHVREADTPYELWVTSTTIS